MTNIANYTAEVDQALQALLAIAKLKPQEIVVVGCSTSEVVGQKIGSASNTEVASGILAGLLPTIEKQDLFLAIQACEHLNRALVVEKACADKYGLEIVAVIPHPKAGGSLAAAAMEAFTQPVVVETIAAHAGLDIGDTLIGMHLKSVAVPVRLASTSIGAAHLTAAHRRPKLIGGARAQYC